MKHIISTILLFSAGTSALCAQTASDAVQRSIDAVPATSSFNLGQRLTADGFTVAQPDDNTHRPGLRKSAILHYSYDAQGTNAYTGESTSWSTLTGYSSNDEALIQDIIPNSLGADGIAVPYKIVGTKMRIEPTFIGSTTDYHIILFSTMSSDGAITFDLLGNGRISISKDAGIIYGAFTTKTYDEDTYQGYYDYYTDISYTKAIISGDANEDGAVSTADAQPIVGHILGRTDNSSDPDAMDTNDDREINVADVIGLAKIIKNKK